MGTKAEFLLKENPDETSYDGGGLGQGGHSGVGGKWPGLASELLEWKDRN